MSHADNDRQLAEEYAQQVRENDQQLAELGQEREQRAELALMFVRGLIETLFPGGKTANEHLRTLCFEAGIPYERIIARARGK